MYRADEVPQLLCSHENYVPRTPGGCMLVFGQVHDNEITQDVSSVVILETITSVVVSRPLFDLSRGSRRPGTSRPQRCTPAATSHVSSAVELCRHSERH